MTRAKRTLVVLSRLRRCGHLLPAALTGYLWLKGGWPDLPGLGCPLRQLTGIPCPTCFLTRATCASLRGDWQAALDLHAFGPVMAAGLILWSLQAIRSRSFYPKGLEAWHLALFGLALVAYWAIRMELSYGLGIGAFPGD